MLAHQLSFSCANVKIQLSKVEKNCHYSDDVIRPSLHIPKGNPFSGSAWNTKWKEKGKGKENVKNEVTVI